MKTTGLILAAITLISWSTQSHAVLINHGDVTRDTSSGLDWLDVNITAGMTYNSILASSYVSDGWRYATGGEIDTLAMRYIGAPEQTFSGGFDFVQTLIVIGLMGPTFQRPLAPDNPATLAVLGYYNDGTADTHAGLAEFVVNFRVPDPAFGEPFVGRWTTFDDFLDSSSRAPQIGSFLVRSSVPEPSTLGLLLLGAGAAWFGRRRSVAAGA